MIYTIRNGHLTVQITDTGAQLQSIRTSDGTEYLWQGCAETWPDRDMTIFPYVARLTQDSYYLDGQLYHMDIHGIAPYSTFRAAQHQADKLVLELAADENTLQQYPRRFVFQVCYTLRDAVLEVAYQVENRDEKAMYFGLGGHPGFQVPLEAGKVFSEYRLRFARRCNPVRIGFSEDCFLNGEDTPYPLEKGTVLPLHHGLFDEDAIVLKDMAREVTLEADGSSRSVTVRFEDFPYLGIWHWPRSEAGYVCLEPWSSLPSRHGQIAVLEAQEDLILLAPGKTYCASWSVEIH